ncbi:MAG: phosphoglucosamine mutase [Cyanobacteria bacterium M5B4]|nr:MAG: phosphoglucosamine mutase [Cyanobacteria bacterium M5B4]
MKLFGTDGVRGHVGSVLTAPLALELGYSIAQVLPGKVALIGQDSRTSSDMIVAALTAGLTSAGKDVYKLGLCPTPAVAYLTAADRDIDLGIMVSASHNPPADNGIKVFGRDGLKISPDCQQQIESALTQPFSPPHSWGQCLPQTQKLADYQASILRSVKSDLTGLKIVLDLAWGAAVSVAESVFAELGAEVISLHNQADGTKINVNCGSTHLLPLQSAVLEHQADVGFAFDGDADRVLAVDPKGREVNGDYILYLWGQELLREERLPDRAIVTTVMANLAFERAWQGNFIRTAVGDQHVQSEMLRHGWMLGGEQSGHVLCRHYGISGDGLLTAVQLASLIKCQAPLDVLVQSSFTPYPQVLQNIPVPDREQRLNWQNCTPLVQLLDQAREELGDRGRVLVRASGTEPVLRVMVEAETQELTDRWLKTIVSSAAQYLHR